MAIDDYAGSGAQNPGMHHPAKGGVLLVNDVPAAKLGRALHVGVGGDASLTLWDGTTEVYKNLISGFVYPYRVRQVNSAGTSATNLISLL